MRGLAALVLALAGIGVFLVGATGPLTPREGLPTLAEGGLWAGGPIFMLLAATNLARTGAMRLLYALLLLGVIGLTVYGAFALMRV